MNKNIFIASLIIISFTLFFWYLVASSFYDISMDTKNDFVTDKCTMFPEGSWGECCKKHDKSYWVGGSAENRRVSDNEFRKCVYKNNKALSFLVYSAVRIGGTPFLAVPWRWGYGWEYGRGYQ